MKEYVRISEELMWEQITRGKYQEYIKNNKLLSKEPDPIPCPNCGSQLTYSNGIRKCTSCDYELTISEIDYTQRNSHLCMICGNSLSENELQICQQCKDKISSNWRRQND